MPRVARVVVADTAHHWTARRYVELNPVRAGMVAQAEAWPWSSAAAHCGTADPDACLDMSMWRRAWSETSWQQFLQQGETEAELRALRQCTHSGRPLGPAEFTEALELQTHRRLAPSKGGRPRTAKKEAGRKGTAVVPDLSLNHE